MRLLDILLTVREALPLLGLEATSLTPGADKRIRLEIANRRQVCSALLSLLEVPGVSREAGIAYSDPICHALGEPVTVFVEDWTIFSKKMTAVIQKCSLIVETLDDMVIEDGPFHLAITLPRIATITDFKSFVNDIELSFDRPIASLIKESVQFGGFDVGSSILRLVVESEASLLIVVAIVDSVRRLLEERAGRARTVQGMSDYAMPEEAIRMVAKANETVLAERAHELAKVLVDARAGAELSTAEKNEASNVVHLAFQRFMDLSERGTELQLSGKAPDEAKALAPDPAVIRQIVASSERSVPLMHE